MIVLDTDHLGEFQRGASEAAQRLRARLELAAEPVVTTIISVEELMRGWLEAIHHEPDPRRQIRSYARLGHLFEFFASWTVVPWDDRAVGVFLDMWQRKVRVGTMDLKIASIVLANQATLLSRNLQDFRRVPGLRVEDWLA
ncbi:MAG: type II toxin-antitoxin system VapC family toxin [Planctomycetes bacterium]|nr:type II toxin-antitoxin system VapC family toxin [Planctomycetota bacterium]